MSFHEYCHAIIAGDGLKSYPFVRINSPLSAWKITLHIRKVEIYLMSLNANQIDERMMPFNIQDMAMKFPERFYCKRTCMLTVYWGGGGVT
jgi:hypothetical protein